ncbi:EMB2654 [Symbiodinium necroappetens]|uniref:EMB2654 protein n=1 Tax=Symbiodinium necroappetens TaxID=1628268 RepID=A0A812W2A8_9DINO|nr:EMB2654 [Symbiodinium necroappetens]
MRQDGAKEQLLGFKSWGHPQRCNGPARTFNRVLSAVGLESWHKAVLLLSRAQSAIVVDTVSFNASVRACTDLSAWHFPSILLMFMRSRNLAPDAFTYNLMLRSFGGLRSKSWESAIRVFFESFCSSAVESDIVGLNSVIHACAKGLVWSIALCLHTVSSVRGLFEIGGPQGANAAISACRDMAWTVALVLLSGLLEQRTASVVSYGATMAALDESNWAKALHLAVLAGPSRYKTVICNSVMSTCGWRRAWSILSGISSPSMVSFGSALGSGRRGGSWPLTLWYLVWMLARRFTPNRITYNAAVDVCRMHGRWIRCLAILNLLQLQSKENRLHSTVIYACDACLKAGNWQSSQVLLCLDQQRLDVVGSSLAIASSSAWPTALTTFGSLQSRHVEAGSATYHAVVAISQEWSEWQRAQQVLIAMQMSQVQTSLATHATAMQAYKKSSKWDFAVQLFGGGSDALQADAILQNAVVDAWGQLHKWQGTMFLLSSMALSLQVPDLPSFNACLVSCEKCKQWKMALSLLNRMRGFQESQGPRPAAATVEAVLAACERCSRWQTSLLVLEAGVEAYSREDLLQRGIGTPEDALELCSEAGAAAFKFKARSSTLQHRITRHVRGLVSQKTKMK